MLKTMRSNRMETERKVRHSALAQNIFVVCFMVLLAGSLALLNNNKSRPLLKFCFNSRDQFVAGQCVLCDFYQFSATVLGCNGKTSALMSNITSTEAVCIISNCLQQVRQAQPQFTGRKKRDSSDESLSSPSPNGRETNGGKDIDTVEIFDEKKELAAVSPSMKEFLSRYVMMDASAMKDLEEQVVDKIEVMVDTDDEDYEE